MMKFVSNIRAACPALLALLLFATAGQSRAAEPPADVKPKSDSGASAASGKSVRKDAKAAATKRSKQPTRGGQAPVSVAPSGTGNAPFAKAAAEGKQNQAQDIPCFKTKLCE
jgi:hypothetical protein